MGSNESLFWGFNSSIPISLRFTMAKTCPYLNIFYQKVPNFLNYDPWTPGEIALDIVQVRSRILPRGARHARHAAASNGWPWDVTGFGVGDHGHRKDTEDAVQLSLYTMGLLGRYSSFLWGDLFLYIYILIYIYIDIHIYIYIGK